MKTTDLIFIGIKGSVIALDRATGVQEWATHLKGCDFVNVVLDDGKIFATCRGEVFCLDPLSGRGLWQNPLKGFGVGLATIAIDGNQAGGLNPVLSEKRRRDEEAAASAAACAAV